MSISALGLRGAQDSDPFENGDFSRPCVFSLTFSRPCGSSPRFKMDSGDTGAPFERIQVLRCRSKSRHLDVVLLAHQHFLVPVSHRTLCYFVRSLCENPTEYSSLGSLLVRENTFLKGTKHARQCRKCWEGLPSHRSILNFSEHCDSD